MRKKAGTVMGQLLGMKGRSVMHKLTAIKKKQFFKNYILWMDGERERENIQLFIY